MMDFYVKIGNPAVDFSLVRKKAVAKTKKLNQVHNHKKLMFLTS
jgi:hypothetical protein